MQTESTVEIPITSKSPSKSSTEDLVNVSETTAEISISNDGPSTSKLSQKQPEQLFITSNYTLSALALLFIALTMSAVVLISPGSRSSKISLADLLEEYVDESDSSNKNEVVSESYDDVNTSYVNPEHAKFEYIHGQLKDLSICLILFNISELNGACLVHNPKNFIEASEACTVHNMTLLEINSEHDKRRIFEETEKIFGTGGGTRIWMNGKYSVSENVFLSHPNNMRFFITNDQVESHYGQKFYNDQCLAIESWYKGKYHISAVPCGGAHYFYCEF